MLAPYANGYTERPAHRPGARRHPAVYVLGTAKYGWTSAVSLTSYQGDQLPSTEVAATRQ